MRKMTFLLVGAAAALAACTTTETVNGPSAEAIGFGDAHLGYPTESRAVTELDGNLTSFQVFGQYTKGEAAAQIFNNVAVSKAPGSSSWTYTGGLRPWIAGADYVFAAYAPAAAITDPEINVNSDGYLTLADYSVFNNQHDLIYAAQTATGQAAGSNTTVQFTFNHLLSIVNFTFASSFGDADTKVAISNVTVSGVPSTATFTANNSVTASGNIGGSWGAASNNKDYTLTIAPITTAEGKSSDNIVVIPQSVPAVTVSFTVNVTNAAGESLVTDKTFTSTIPTTPVAAWEPGYKYNYVATITPASVNLDYIQFNVASVEAWKDAAEGDQDLALQ